MPHRALAWLAVALAACTLILQIAASRAGPEEPAASLGWLLESERAFVRVLRGGRWDNRTMQAAMADFERLGAQDPFYGHHYLVYAHWARERLEKAPKSYLTSYDLAMLRYLEGREDPAEALLLLAGRRVDPAYYVPELYHQWAKGFFSADRGQALLNELLPHIRPARLKGATVADIGSGPGQFARRLLDLVGDQGKVLAIDICPSVAEVQAPMALLDPDFERIQFRIIERQAWGIAGVWPEDRLDFAFLMDVHLLSEPAEGLQEQAQDAWLEAVRAALRPGGTFFLFESSGAPQALEWTRQWLARSRFRGPKKYGPGLHFQGKGSFFIQVQKTEETLPLGEESDSFPTATSTGQS